MCWSEGRYDLLLGNSHPAKQVLSQHSAFNGGGVIVQLLSFWFVTSILLKTILCRFAIFFALCFILFLLHFWRISNIDNLSLKSLTFSLSVLLATSHDCFTHATQKMQLGSCTTCQWKPCSLLVASVARSHRRRQPNGRSSCRCTTGKRTACSGGRGRSLDDEVGGVGRQVLGGGLRIHEKRVSAGPSLIALTCDQI